MSTLEKIRDRLGRIGKLDAIAVADRSAGGAGRSGRDLRLDFFRGLALIFIFIDHVPGNSLAHLTMRAFGISDAAEVFVLIAGFAAFMAYSGVIEREGFHQGVRRIGRRIRDLYAAHVLLVAVCAVLLAGVSRTFDNPLYFEDVNLTPFAYDPLGAIWRTLLLTYQPGYINILPMYVALLAWLPAVIWMLGRVGPLATIATSAAIWLAAGSLGLNLPSWPEVHGWYFNPLAWQFLFTIGATAAFLGRRGMTLPASPVGIVASLTVIGIGFIVSAPWINIPLLGLPRLVPFDALGYVSKTDLSPWRLAHVLAVAYVTALLVPSTASWMRSRIATWIIDCGRNSLDIFCLGTVLSFIGFAVMLELGRTWEYQVLVNVVGIGAMIGTASWLTRRKAQRVSRANAGASHGETVPQAQVKAGP